MTEFWVKGHRDVTSLKQLSGLDKIVIYSARLKYQNLLQYALKYALWAGKAGSMIQIIDNGPYSADSRAYVISFNQVKRIAWQFLKNEVSLVESKSSDNSVTFRIENEPVDNDMWSCGIIYGGAFDERALLVNCIKSVLNQLEFKNPRSEIIVYGPADVNYDFLGELKSKVQILFSENFQDNGRFLISLKKNTLIRHFRNEKCLLIHSRIMLKDTCLATLPSKFDFITPFVYVNDKEKTRRYLDFRLNGYYVLTETRKSFYTPIYCSNNYHRQLKFGQPFIDGGLMIFRRAVLLDTPLNNYLGWFEDEDVDLASRLNSNGFLVDYEPSSFAFSQTDKLPKPRITLSDNFVVKMLKFLNNYLSTVFRYTLYLLYRNNLK